MKKVFKLFWLVLFVSTISWSTCFADTDEDSAEDTPPLPKIYNIGEEPPKPKIKPKVIIKERVVVQCPPGSSWSSSIKRCLNEDGEDIAPAQRQAPQRAAEPPTAQYASPSITFDFETGDLNGWTATGNAFKFQPTYGDNPTARHRGQPSNHQGNYWIGTYENRPTHRHAAGHTQGDGPKGTLTSASFTINSNSINFLIGGGCDLNTVRAELLIDGRVVDKVTGKCTETMERDSFPVSKYMGRTAQIRLVDDSSGGWGHINFDELRFE